MPISGQAQSRIQNHAVFFALTACSWVPHWTCHYFRLGTNSSFIVADWTFTKLHSEISLACYAVLVALNILAIVRTGLRLFAAGLSGVGHTCIGALHLFRLVRPFPFLILGQPWSLTASAIQAGILLPYGILCLAIAFNLNRGRLVSSPDSRTV